MKYCVQYYKDFRYNDIIDEIIYTYNDNIVNDITNAGWKDTQRIIIDVFAEEDSDTILPILQMCKKVHSNIVICLGTWQINLTQKLKEIDYPFFFLNTANTNDEVYALIKKGASDVYITESLAFNIVNVGTYCKDKGINVRIIPNVAQYKAGYKDEIEDPYKFFVRPEDVELYESYADVFEIKAPTDKLSIIYEIYRNKQWMGDLGRLITGFSEPFYNSGLVPYFGPERLKCGQRCMQEKCNLCQQMKELAAKFKDNDLTLKRAKDKEWKNETESYQKAMQFVEETAPGGDDEVPEEQGVSEDN